MTKLLETSLDETVAILTFLAVFSLLLHWATPFYLILRKRKQLRKFPAVPQGFTPAFTCTYLLSTFQVNLVSHGKFIFVRRHFNF